MQTRKIELQKTETGQFKLGLLDQDGSTLARSQIILDYVPQKVSQESIALASLFCFRQGLSRSRISGISIPPQLSAAISRSLGSASPAFDISESFEEKASQTELFLTRDDSGTISQPASGPRRVLITVLDSAQWSGRLFNLDRMLVAANLSGLAGSLGHNDDFLASVGILLSEDFRATKIRVETSSEIDEESALLCGAARAAGFDIRFLKTSLFKEALTSDVS